MHESIAEFLSGETFAVAGASPNREKYGNKCLRCYVQDQRKVYPLHPRESVVEGLDAYSSLADLPEAVHGLSIITPPAVTEGLVEQAGSAGIRHIWMQPGAESSEAVRRAHELGLNVISGGPCLLVVLGFQE